MYLLMSRKLFKKKKKKLKTNATIGSQKENNQKLKFNKKLFFQIQGQLFVTQRKYCDFIVWTPKRINVETVETIVVGDQFMKNILPKLKHFDFKSTVQSLDILRTLIDCTFFDKRQTQKLLWRELICRDTTVFYIT
jgi:hypothetical protein